MSDLFARDLRPFDSLLSATTLRHRVIATNLANIETPGYTRSEVSFEQALAHELRKGASLEESLEGLEPITALDTESEARPDGNNVDLDRETGELQKNNTLHDLYARILSMKLAQFQAAIQGR